MRYITRSLLAVLLAIPVHAAAAASAGEDRLKNTQWVLVSFVEGAVASPPLAGTRITLEFPEDGQHATGDSGCNSYGVGYRIKDNWISFGQASGTLMACRDPVMKQEERYFRALASAGRFELTGSHLKISYDSGRRALVFARSG